MKTLLAIAFGVLCGLLASGMILLVAEKPQGEAVALLPPATPAPLIVHVYGSVVSPGVYQLLPGSRVQDAVEAAGGLLADADLRAVNLAAELEDGSQLIVPALRPTWETLATLPAAASSSTAYPQRFNSTAPLIININTATQDELEWLPGIGPSLASQIIVYREANGPFERIDDILDVPGIGPKTFEKIKNLITI